MVPTYAPHCARLCPARAHACARVGWRLEEGDHGLAIACFTAYIRDNPKAAAGYNARGIAYARKKEFDKAIADYDEAILLDPKKVASYINRGSAHLGKKEYARAIADYDAAIRLDPGFAR